MKYLGWLVLCMGLWQCGNVKRVDTAEMKELIEQDKIRKVSPADFQLRVEELGDALADSLTADLAARQAENPCDLQHSALAKRWQAKGVRMHLIGMPDVQTIRTLLPKELEVVQAYAYAAENKQSMAPNVQRIGDSLWVYTAPIAKEKGIAVKCFSDETYYFSLWSFVFPNKILTH